MIDLRYLYTAEQGFCNPTIRNYSRKIEIINLTPTKKVAVPFRIIERNDYILLFLIFNQL